MGEFFRSIEIDETGNEESLGRAGTAAIDLDAFNVFRTSVTAGRVFDSRDLAAGANSVVVNRLFVERVLAGRNAVGRRIRYAAEEPGRWFEIVGVVSDLVRDPGLPLDVDLPARPVVYSPLGRGEESSYPVYLAAHVRGDPALLVPTLRRLANDLSPRSPTA